jgi:hypothetical protein
MGGRAFGYLPSLGVRHAARVGGHRNDLSNARGTPRQLMPL